jgi:hypothetical protein
MFQSSKLLLLAIAGFAFMSCSDPQVVQTEDSSSGRTGDSSSSVNGGGNGLSSSGGLSSSEASSSSLDLGLNCAYKPSWCSNIAYIDVIRESQTGDVNDGPKCIFATAIAQMGNQSNGALLVNGVKLTGQYGSNVFGRCGSAYGWSQLPCSEALTQVQKADGGYYIYVDEWAGEFNTTGGAPVCTGPSGGGSTSSSSTTGTTQSSSSIGSNSSSSSISSSSESDSGTGKCIAPGYFDPPDGPLETCIVVNNKCYLCNPERGVEACSNQWIWQGGNVSDLYWYKETPCSSGGVPSTLTCTGLAANVLTNTTIATSSLTVKCDNTTLTSGITWSPTTLNWPTTGNKVVTATASCGGSNKTAQCGEVMVVAPSSLTCTGLAQTGVVGTKITQPTVQCDGSNVTTGLSWTNAPAWDSPTANTYNVSVSANCGGSPITAGCGSIKVEAAPVFTLTCINLPTTGTVGTAITKPTVRCNGTAVTTAITWANAPAWDNPTTAQEYNNVKATATCGSSQQTVTCTGGPLKVVAAPTLTCAALPQTSGTAGTSITTPTVKCGETTIPFGNISWSSTPGGLNWASPAVNNYANIKATADCSGKQQTANCSGSLSITAAPQTQTLTCASATQTVTKPAYTTAPEVKCGNTVVSSGSITWQNITWGNTTVGTYSNISAKATSGNCNNQTANCAGTVIVNAAPISSSSVSGGSSSASVSGCARVNYQTLTAGASGVKNGWTSRYWDACKQSCSWGGKTQASPLTSSDRCKACEKNGTTQIAANDANKSSCDGGNSYTCFDFTPCKVDDNLAYAFAASPTDQCGKCFQIQFDGGFQHGTANATHQAVKGKTLIVMTSNMGGDVQGGQFDVLIPGGGVGQFDAFSNDKPYGQLSVSKSQLGEQYGGLLSACEKEESYNSAKYKSCLTTKCSIFTNQTLKDGCLFYANWMEAANNPTMIYKEIACPDYLLNKYKATMK